MSKSWDDVLGKFRTFNARRGKQASLGPDGAVKEPVSQGAPGKGDRQFPSQPRSRRRYKPQRTRFADIMEGVTNV